jgi:hypothetical protein
MRKLTDENRAELKGSHGADLRVIELEEYEDLVVVVKRPSLKAWAAAFDGIGKPATRADALHNLLIDCAVWPSPSELATLLDLVPALPDTVWPVLAELAGAPDEEIQPIEPSKLTGEDRAALAAAGLTEAQLQDLVSAHPRRGQLAIVRVPGGFWLLKRPSVSRYNAFRRLSALGKMFEGLHKMTLGSVLWPNEETVGAVVERAPGLASAVGEVLMSMAGEGARVRVGGI